MANTTFSFRLSAVYLGLAASLCAQTAPAPSAVDASPAVPPAFVNDICLPSALYMLADTPNDVFVQPFLKRWRPYNDFVRFGMKDKNAFSRRLSHVATVSKPTDGAVLHVDLVNGDEFKTVKRLAPVLRVGRKGVGEKDVYAQIIGDSLTHGRFFQAALLDSGYVPKLHLVGLLKFADGQYNEGRGGWSLASYFSVPSRPGRSYHGFMQPEGARYWGNRAFWKMAWRCVRKTQPKGFEPSYSCARFDSCVTRFDEQTGVLLNPAKGDVQFDEGEKSFVRYDGAAWRAVPAQSLKWRFDYGKYLQMWNIPPPQFLFVSLGVNDFRGRLNADYSTWEQQITTMKESYLAACPDGKFVIAIPISTCGSIDNAAGDFTPLQNAAMWNFRNWLIQTFDKREKDGFYLLDGGIATDNDYGFNLAKGSVTVPFEGCTGEENLRVQTGNPHPYPNYVTMGLPFAAFIQYHR